MEEAFYCPDCSRQLERLYSCGSDSYVCNTCRRIVSRKNIISEKEIVSKVVKTVVKALNQEDIK